MNAIAINPSLLTVSPSLLCQLLLAAMEGIATKPDTTEITVRQGHIDWLMYWVSMNPDPQVRAWALRELERRTP